MPKCHKNFNFPISWKQNISHSYENFACSLDFRETDLFHLPVTLQVRAPNHHENQNQLATKMQKGNACV